MLLQKACLCLLLVLNVECARRQDAGTLRKEYGLRTRRAARGDVFENLFNVYDPSFLSGVWPKISNGVHLTLEQACWEDMAVLFSDLAEGRAWAYDAVDASGRYQSALFAGSRFWLGSKQECLRLDEASQEGVDNETLALLRNNEYIDSVLRKQKYFDAEINDWRWLAQPEALAARLAAAARPPRRLRYTTLHVQINVTKITMLKSYDIVLGVCLPRSCPPSDVEAILNFSVLLSDNLKTNRTVPRTVNIVSSRTIRGEFHIENDAGAILLITVTSLLVILATIATLVDLDLMKCIRYRKQSMSFDLPTYNNGETKLVDELKRKHGEIKSVDDILSESANLNYAAANKISRSLAAPSPLTLDVNSVGMSGSCNRCGKYKRQCPNSKPTDSSATCPRLKYSSFASLSTEDRRKNSFFCQLLLCFSVRYCWNRIFNKNTANKDLALIHVMRIVATLWVMFVQVAVMVGYTSDNAGDINDRDNLYYILATGTIAFDTLFFVSGVFSAHHFFYLRSRYSVQQLVSFSGACGHFMHAVCTATNRVARMLPSYAYTVLLSAVVSRASLAYSTLALPDGDHRNCDHYWWRNLLYISNMYPRQEQCLQISWYLSTETQLHALGAAACAAAAARARPVLLAAAVLALAATAADISGAYQENDALYTDTYSMYSGVVERGWARVAPYFAGLLAGWLAHGLRGRIKLTKLLAALLWGASLPLLCAAAALPLLRPAWLAAGLHVAWPCALLWPALASSTYYAGPRRVRRAGAALSRLSGGALLLHGAAARALLTAPDAALCSHLACIWMYWAGAAAAALGAALLLALLLEAPACALLRRLADCAAA